MTIRHEFLLTLSTLVASIACGGESVPATGPTAERDNIRLEVTFANGVNNPRTGLFQYEVRTRVENSGAEGIDYSLTPTFYDTSGAVLQGVATIGPSSFGVGRLSIATDTLRPYDNTLSNPWAERVAIRLSYRMAQGPERVLTASFPVTHGPPIARLHEFTVSPERVRPLEPITIRWNVSHATTVRLFTVVFDPVTGLSAPLTDSSPVGSHVIVPTPNNQSVSLLIDDWLPQLRPITITP